MEPASYSSSDLSAEDMNLFRPPVIQATGILNKALFSKTVNLAAALVKNPKDLARYRKALQSSGEILQVERIPSIALHPDSSLAAQGKKCLLLRPGVNPQAPDTWGPVVKEGVKSEEIGIIPYDLKLDYDTWTSHDVISSILPPELHDEVPGGFNTVGHVAHLNLREQYLPYKKVIGQVLLDKNPHITTVINKIDDVGTESEFRTFSYELLAGTDDLNVEVREGGCTFSFDYSKVYWNSKLETEHKRLISLFQPGEVVCDVMAGIGPFAVPAGKKGVFVWANDMNPESYLYLRKATDLNKVSQFVRPFNEDGRDFIRHAADSVLQASRNKEHALVQPRSAKRGRDPSERPPPTRVPIPPTISHFVMNLPASAITFVHHYKGLYAGHEDLFAPDTETKLPLVHVHCFALKSDDDVPLQDISERISKELGMTMRPGDAENEGEITIFDVRDVAPAKRMFCATFRLPAEVAFAARA